MKNRRRDLTKFNYEPKRCWNYFDFEREELRSTQHCSEGDNCSKSHSFEEMYFHSSIYRSMKCSSVGTDFDCQLIKTDEGEDSWSYCPYYHSESSHIVRPIILGMCSVELSCTTYGL